MRRPVPTLARLTAALAAAGAIAAVEPSSAPPGGGTVIAPGSGGSSVTPVNSPALRNQPSLGRINPIGSQNERQVVVHGLLDLDYLSQNNYEDGNDDRPDSVNEGRIRSEIGLDLELDDRLKVVTTLAFDAEMGDDSENAADDAGDRGEVVLDDAYVVLKSFLGQSGLSLRLGRQPVAWNLRKNYPAFLFDSRADDPDVTSWDGASARFGLETLTFSPYAYVLPDESTLYGLAVDWQPAQAATSNLFITGSGNVQYDLPVGGIIADSLQTFYLGMEWSFESGLDLYVEGAMQRGTQDSDVEFRGYGISGGVEWRLPTPTPVLFGVQYDLLSGDDDDTDDSNRTFINPFEGTSDTYIVESEKYGELLAGQFGNLRAAKARAEVAFDRDNRLRMKAVFGHYQFDQDLGAGRDLGQELDLTLIWQYTTNTTISVLGGVFLPDDGFASIAADQTAPDDDAIWLFAANLLVSF